MRIAGVNFQRFFITAILYIYGRSLLHKSYIGHTMPPLSHRLTIHINNLISIMKYLNTYTQLYSIRKKCGYHRQAKENLIVNDGRR